MCWVTVIFAQQNKNNQTLFPVKTADKWGFIDIAGAVKIQPQYDAVDLFDTSGLCVVELNNKVGLINLEGNTIIDCQYDLLKILSKGLILTKNNGICCLRNFSNDLLIEDVGGKVTLLKNGYFTYEKINGIGLGHLQKGLLTDPVYKKIGTSNSNKYFVINDPSDFEGLIDTTGKVIIFPQYDSIIPYEKYFIVKKGPHWGALKTNGDSILNTGYGYIASFDDNILSVCKNSACKLYSTVFGKYILDNYRTAEVFENYIFFTSNNKPNGLIDTAGNEIMVGNFAKFEHFHEDIFKVKNKNSGEWGLCDLKKRELILEMNYMQVEKFSNKIAKVRDISNGTLGLFDFKNKQMIVNPSYSEINNLNEKNLTTFKLGDNYGVINSEGKIILEPNYSILSFYNDVVKGRTKNTLEYHHFDKEGNLVESEVYEQFKNITVNSITNDSLLNNQAPQLTNNNLGRGPQINDSLVWTRGGRGKYGVFNTRSGKFVLAPIFESYMVFPSLDFSVAEIKYIKESFVFNVGYEYKTNSKFLLVSNKTGKPITKPDFLHIEFNDFIEDSLPLARCITEGTKYGLINKEGKVVISGMAFIDKFVEGKARCSKQGILTVKADDNCSLIPSGTFFRSLIFNRDQFIGTLHGNIFCQGAEWGFIDTTANWVIKPSTHKLHYVKHFSNDRSMVMKNNKWGLIDNFGLIVLPVEYDEISFVPNSNNTLYFVSKNTKRKGCIDNEGKVVIPANYDKTGQFNEGFVNVFKDGKWGFADMNGNELIKCQYSNVHKFSEGLAAVTIKGRWGYIDNTGKIIVKPVFTKVGDFKEGLAWARQTNGKMAFITSTGEVKFEDNFVVANDMESGVARVKVASKGWCLIDKDGNYLSKPNPYISNIEPFNQHNLAKVKIGKRYRLMDRNGNMIKKCNYTQIDNFKEGYAVVRKHGFHNFVLFRNTKFGFIDSTGKLTCRPKFSDLGEISCGLAIFLNKKGKYGFVNPNGKIVIKPEYIKVSPFIAGRAVVYKKHNCSGIIDTNSNYIVAPNLDKIINVTENIALVKTAFNTFHFMHEDLQRHSPANFQAAHNFYNGIAPVRTSNQLWGVVNKKGIQLVTAKYGGIEKFKNGFANIEVNKYQGIVNKMGKEIVPTDFEYLNYVGSNILRLEKDNKVGYMNSDGTWIWGMNE